MEKEKIAVVGCGMISDTYLESLKQFLILEVDSCCDLNMEKAEKLAQKYGINARTYQEILADDSIGMILNLTNPKAHFGISKAALEAGKHVYTEKMIAVEWEDGMELCRLAKENKLRLGVAPDTFLGAGIQTARYYIDHGVIGEVTSALVSLNKDFEVLGEILPHLNQKGGDLLFDSGCYYLTALTYLLGSAKQVQGMTAVHNPLRVNRRVGSEHYGETYRTLCENVAAGSIIFSSGVIASFHFNAESVMTELFRFEIYGTKGILRLGDPNTFQGEVELIKPLQEPVKLPFTHGYQNQARGIGAAEMAWSIKMERPHRASMEQALHVFEMAHGILKSAKSGSVYFMQTTMERPRPLPDGYLDNGNFGPTPERALAE